MCVNISSKFVLNIPHLNTLSEKGIWVDISWMYACNILQYGHTCRGRTYVYKSRGCLHQISLKEGPLLWRDMCYIFRGTLVQMSQILYDEWSRPQLWPSLWLWKPITDWSFAALHMPFINSAMQCNVDFIPFIVQMEIHVTKSLRKVANEDGREG